MMELWREWLYPLGFLSSLAFGGRFLLQWITSEVRQQSTVTRLFWKISLTGNLLLLFHSMIQMQYHVSFFQSCNAVISWRNLNLMQKQQAKFQPVIVLFVCAVTLTTALFALQGHYTDTAWFRIPTISWLPRSGQIDQTWHLIGFLGLALFSSRFWVQWWCAEKHQTSYLGPAFWWLSLVGDLLTLSYFLRIADPVNLLGPAFGLIPYIRNLMLIRKQQRENTAYES